MLAGSVSLLALSLASGNSGLWAECLAIGFVLDLSKSTLGKRAWVSVKAWPLS